MTPLCDGVKFLLTLQLNVSVFIAMSVQQEIQFNSNRSVYVRPEVYVYMSCSVHHNTFILSHVAVTIDR